MVGHQFDWINTKKKFEAIAATTKDGRPTLEQLKMNRMPY